MAQHTPGPFWFDPRAYLNILAHDPTGTMGSGIVLATLDDIPNGLPHEQKIHNAYLFVAAPDLLAALERLIEAAPAFREASVGSPWSDARRRQNLHQEAEDIALAAIAKAKGVSS